MKSKTIILLVSMIMLFLSSCAKKSYPSLNNYPANSLTNGETWFANGFALRVRSLNNESCTDNRFILYLRTDIAYKGDPYAKTNDTLSGCIKDCNPKQIVSFNNVPLKKGRYKTSYLDKCGTLDKDGAYYQLLTSSGGVFKKYVPKKNKASWIRVDEYDIKNNIITGKFELDLNGVKKPNFIDSTESNVYFKKGNFRVTLLNKMPE